MCIGCPGANSIFGNNGAYIRILNSDFVAIEGMNTVERLLAGDVRIPYKQLLKSRVILKAGQVNYLLNHLGLGDNATFLVIKATYNAKSVNEEDNYIVWNYYDDFARTYPMNQLMVLTGNSGNRIKQIYLTNPNTNYPVILDIMVAVIDDDYSFFSDTVNQIGLSFTGLTLESIETYVPNESIVIWDNNVPRSPLAYLVLNTINSISRTGKLLIVDDASVGRLFLDFSTEYDAKQANSVMSYVMENPNVIIQDLSPVADSAEPVVYFYSNVGATASGATISVAGTSSVPADTTMGFTFSTTISLTQSGTNSAITKDLLVDLLIDQVVDNRDGILQLSGTDITLYDSLNIPQVIITSTGTYSFTFDVTDIAGNSLDASINFSLTIIT